MKREQNKSDGSATCWGAHAQLVCCTKTVTVPAEPSRSGFGALAKTHFAPAPRERKVHAGEGAGISTRGRVRSPDRSSRFK